MFQENDILYEDNHLLVVNKRCGDLVQPDPSGESALENEIKAFIKARDGKPGEVFLGVVHRIDRPVSGAIIFAKTSKALSRMTLKIKEREFRKTYLAIVKNKPPHEAGELSDYMVKNETQNKSYIVSSSTKGAKLAQLRYRLIGASDSYYLLEVELITGRHHQIRAQLAHMGCPIKGDLKYGFPRSNPDASISLHAYKLQFEHPTLKSLIEIKAPTPGGMPWDAFKVEN